MYPTPKLIPKMNALSGDSWLFGSGKDGDMTITTNTNLTSTQDGNMVIYNLRNLTINSGCTLTVSNRCKGLLLRIRGSLVVNGTLTMTARGAYASTPAAVPIDNGNSITTCTIDELNAYLKQTGISIPAAGGAGGVVTGSWGYNNTTKYCAPSPSVAGVAAPAYGTGGGGAGGSATAQYDNQNNVNNKGGSGTAGTAASGGSGGGGCGAQTSGAGGDGTVPCGAGGAGHASATSSDGRVSDGGSGGAGNPGGTGGASADGGAPGNAGGSGTGGILVILVQGNIYIGAAGLISANGVKGGDAPSCLGTTRYCAGGGGGSGGGAVIVVYAGLLTNNGTIQASGGASGAGTYNGTPAQVSASGGPGGAGSVTRLKFPALIT